MSVPSCSFFSRESGRIWYNYREMTTDYDDVRFPPPGKTPREDTAAVMKFYKLPKAFPPAVMKEARAIGAAGVGGSGYEVAELKPDELREGLRTGTPSAACRTSSPPRYPHAASSPEAETAVDRNRFSLAGKYSKFQFYGKARAPTSSMRTASKRAVPVAWRRRR